MIIATIIAENLEIEAGQDQGKMKGKQEQQRLLSKSKS